MEKTVLVEFTTREQRLYRTLCNITDYEISHDAINLLMMDKVRGFNPLYIDEYKHTSENRYLIKFIY